MEQSGFSTRAESITQFLTVFLVFLLVLAITYLTTRFVGNFQKASNFNKNFEAIETYRVTNGKYLQLVRVGSKYIVIGISKDNISQICELNEEDIIFGDSTSSAVPDAFKNILEITRERIKKGGNQNEK